MAASNFAPSQWVIYTPRDQKHIFIFVCKTQIHTHSEFTKTDIQYIFGIKMSGKGQLGKKKKKNQSKTAPKGDDNKHGVFKLSLLKLLPLTKLLDNLILFSSL